MRFNESFHIMTKIQLLQETHLKTKITDTSFPQAAGLDQLAVPYPQFQRLHYMNTWTGWLEIAYRLQPLENDRITSRPIFPRKLKRPY